MIAVLVQVLTSDNKNLASPQIPPVQPCFCRPGEPFNTHLNAGLDTRVPPFRPRLAGMKLHTKPITVSWSWPQRGILLHAAWYKSDFYAGLGCLRGEVQGALNSPIIADNVAVSKQLLGVPIAKTGSDLWLFPVVQMGSKLLQRSSWEQRADNLWVTHRGLWEVEQEVG